MKKIFLFAFCIVPTFSLYSCLSRISCCNKRIPYDRALVKWQHLFNKGVVLNNTVASRELMNIRYEPAKELLKQHPRLINEPSLSNDTPLTFIAFLRARPKTPIDDAYWNPIIAEFKRQGAR